MRNEASTSPQHSDPTLRGRRYAIPFQQVWTAALRQASSTRRWVLVEADDLRGRLRVEARPRLLGAISDVEICVRLDGDAQTRVDLLSRARKPGWDLGQHSRRIRSFLRNLDRTLGASDAAILSPQEGADSLPELASL